MMNANASNRHETDDSLCSFCNKSRAVLSVSRKVPHRRKPKREALCLLHFYSTSASREASVAVTDPSEMKVQYPKVQELFAEGYLQLQQSLSEHAARSFRAHDPLSIVSDLHKTSTRGVPRHRLKAPPKPSQRRDNSATEGGFLRDIPIPDRLLKVQQQQSKWQEGLLERMDRASKEKTDEKTTISQSEQRNRTSKRRKMSKNIWNTVLEHIAPSSDGAITADSVDKNDTISAEYPCTSCGSNRVSLLSSSSRRNQDMAKGETWGSKSRDDEVTVRCQCRDCGKVWTQEE